MGAVFQFVLVVAIAIVAFNVYTFLQKPVLKLEIDDDGWFGSGQKRPDNRAVVPFSVKVPEDVIKDLKERLAHSRILHEPLEGSDNFEYGFNPKYLKTVVQHWAQKFDWRKQEALLNKIPQFTTEIEGLKIHFYSQSPPSKKYKKVIPLLIVHGWPGNVFEFHKIIPMLSDPSEYLGLKTDIAFEVIAPSIPGYGWSGVPKKTGFNQWSTARIFNKLMARLGHKRYFLQGGDWGSAVCTNIALYYPNNVLGLHLNMAHVSPLLNAKTMFLSVVGSFAPTAVYASPAAHWFSLKDIFYRVLMATGYAHFQATEPDTVGTALNDSPCGLAAYILTRFAAWTNREYRALPDGGLTQKFTMDELLTIVSMYWIKGNIVNSQRYYKEYFHCPQWYVVDRSYIATPTAYAAFPNEIIGSPPKEMLECRYNLTSYTDMPVGGHFAALEQPKLLARDVFKFVEMLK